MSLEDCWTLLSDPQGGHVLGGAWEPWPVLFWERIGEMNGDSMHVLKTGKRDLIIVRMYEAQHVRIGKHVDIT